MVGRFCGTVEHPLVAMADPWLVAICAAAQPLVVLRRRAPRLRWPSLQNRSIPCIQSHGAGAGDAALDSGNPRRRRSPSRSRLMELPYHGTFRRTPHPSANGASLLSTRRGLVATHRCMTICRLWRHHDRSTQSGISLHTHQWDSRCDALENGRSGCYVGYRYCAAAPPARQSAIMERRSRVRYGSADFRSPGRALTQIVRVGEWLQTRPAGP